LECANILWKKVRLREISMQQASETLAEIVSGVIEFRPSIQFAAAALRLGAELEHPVYDCVYLALAEAENAELVTADRALWERVTDRRPKIRAHRVADRLPSVH
jgi:predicted nucleic acid-binding protein